MTAQEKSDLVRRLALEAGFDAVGIAAATLIARRAYFMDWLGRGGHGEMDYLAQATEVRVDPRRLLDGARSVIVAVQSYKPAEEPKQAGGPDGPRGRIARYAWGRDYHRFHRRKLQRLVSVLREAIGEAFEARVCVDTAPILEREVAAASGVGWIGKNTLVLHPRLGSYLFLGEIVTTLELAPSEPMTDHCGSCTRCLDACPTQAFPAPYEMDATRCIAYLTIEHRGEIPREQQPGMGEWVFGCDICQEVCPHNSKALPASEHAYGVSDRFPLAPSPQLQVLLDMSEEQRRQWLAGSAMRRATLAMLKRNASIARENQQKRQKVKMSKSQNDDEVNWP
jgi:epoxyqueuosine reductase